jgi:hypothetical protein
MTPTSRNLSGGRLTAIIVGAAIATVAMMALASAAALSWVDGKKDADGYFTTDSERFSTNTYALATEDLDIDDGVPGGNDPYGKVRFKVRSDGGAPVFVGIARTDDVDRYLGASAHATLTDVEVDPFRAEYRTSGGDRRPAAPGTQSIWETSAEGGGTQTLTWDIEDGNWSVVVMNADGSPGVSTAVSVGADAPIVGDLAEAALIAGIVLLVGGGGAMAAGAISPRRRRPSWPAGSASAA